MKNLSDDALTKLANAAFREAANDAIDRAIATNTPLILWVDGKVAEVDPRTVKRPTVRTRRRNARR
jgi:hypothetical protein